MMDFLKNLSQSSNIKVEMETQEYLQDAMGNLSQSSYVKGFDPTQNSMAKNQPNALLH